MIPRLVATDLDGTLLRSDGTLDARTREAIAQVEASGVPVVLCTARPARVLAQLAQATGHRGIAVCSNGSVIWDLHTETMIDTFPFALQAAREVVARLRAALPDATWAMERHDVFAREPCYVPQWPVPEDTVIDELDALLAVAPLQLMVRHPSLTGDELVAHARELVSDLAELSHSSKVDTLLEIGAAGVSKASGLALLCERHGVTPSEVLAFGDMPNDLAMLEWAGRSVAVANAHPDVIAIADEVTASNDECGVAVVLERLVAGGSVGGAA
ncbi:MAG TPA: Cof-type HAD-IIB family hydrolase [Solirubrobacteraceae bacterium]|nr:Cof-type HAD-IIB family hydrolase [Solirubrobacteraceae bacterium]